MTDTPRISYEELPPNLQEHLRARVERLGYLGEFFQVAAHQPEALEHFSAFTEALKVAVPWRLVESIALTVASETGNSYELVQHQRLALKIGMTEAEVRALTAGPMGSLGAFSPAERAAVRLGREVVLAGGRGCTVEFDALADLVGHVHAVGCLMVACRYLAHATMANTWGLQPPLPSPLAVAGAHG